MKGESMKLSTRAGYAITSMMQLALCDSTRHLTLSEISSSQGISISYLEQIFSKLRKRGLVHGTRGPGGGYALSCSLDKISIADIITAVDESAYSNQRIDMSLQSTSNVQELWSLFSAQLFDYLDKLTLAEIVERNKVANLTSNKEVG